MLKGRVNTAFERAKLGGKKKGKGKEEEKKLIEKCDVLVALEYPEWRKNVIEILQGFEFDQNGKIQGNHIQAIKQKIQGPN